MTTEPSGGTDAIGSSSEGRLPQWANGQDGWVRAIVRDVVRGGTPVSDLDIDRYLEVLLSEKKLSSDPYDPVPKIEEKQRDTNPLEAVRLDSLQVKDGVNALRSGTQIDFAARVTVVFGENGSGKSGFVRVLKRAAGVRTAEDILHNIRVESPPPPSGSFTITVGSASRSIDWNDDFGLAPLSRVSVFDARGAHLHVEEDLTYVYTPGELNLFPIVQNAIERVRAALESAIARRTPGPNALLGSFDRSSSIYPTIETLGAATDLDEIRSCAGLLTDIDAQVDSLTIEVDALRSTNIHTELKRVRSRAGIVKDLRKTIDVTAAFDKAEYDSHLAARNSAARRHDDAGSTAFEGLGIQVFLVWNGVSSYRLERITCGLTRPVTTRSPTHPAPIASNRSRPRLSGC